MSHAPLVAITGGYGAVGFAVARELLGTGHVRLRIGGRRLEAAQRLVDQLAGPAEALAVDVTDAEDLAGFCHGCQVVINCAGPSHRIADRVAQAAFAAGADYVDVGGYDPGCTSTDRTGILASGVLPGLSGLLPRVLAETGPAEPKRLICYFGGLDRLSPIAAADVIASLHDGSGESLAMWRYGRRARSALTPLADVELPLLPGPASAVPYLSSEAQRLARDLGLEELFWYNVYPGMQTLAALNRAQAGGGHRDNSSIVGDLVRSVEIDLAGRSPYLVALAQLDGEMDGHSVTRSLLLRANEPTELNGMVAALATSALLTHDVPRGLHNAAEVLTPKTVYEALERSSFVDVLTVVDGPLDAATLFDEGAL